MTERKSIFARIWAGLTGLIGLYNPRTIREKGFLWATGLALATMVVVTVILGILWSIEPEPFDVAENARIEAGEAPPVAGYITTATLARIASTLLDKSGGYLSNDVMPPGIYLDNMPNWEFGVLVQIRDATRALRNDFGRSQTQSTEDADLAIAEPQFNFPNDSWIFPSTESEYRKGIQALQRFQARLAQTQDVNAQFYTRADNLREWLAVVEKRLGSLSQRLSASVGQQRVNVDLAGDPAAGKSTERPAEFEVKTAWTDIDDVFYEARGTAWALIHLIKALEIDFDDVLKKKNARVSLRQISRELESTQDQLWSPIILNGTGFGLFANHSLVMASYISRANSAVIDLRNLMSQG